MCWKIQLNLSTMATFETEESGHCRKGAVVERLKQEWIYGLSAKKMAIVERWPLWKGSRLWRFDCINIIKRIKYFFLRFIYSVRCCQTCSLSLAYVTDVERGGGGRGRTERERGLGREGKDPFLSLFRFWLFPPLLPSLPSLPFIFSRLPRRLSVLLECLRWNKLTRTTTCVRKWQ